MSHQRSESSLPSTERKLMNRRDFLKTAGLASATLALAACAPVGAPVAPATTAGEGAAAAEPVLAGTVNYWHHFTSETEFIGMERVIALFNEKYPDIEVIQENIPNADFMAKFTAAVQANSRPDTAMVASDRLPDMVAMGGLVDLTDRVNNWELKSFFPANRWEGISIDGKIYGVPAFTFVDWGYYRKDWFEEAGIDGPPTTMDEFLDAAIKLTDPAQGRYGFGMRAGDGGHGFVIDMLESFGSPIVVDGEPAIDREKAIEGVRFWSELYTVHKVVPPSAPNDSYRQIMEGFKTGQTAMVWHHTGSLTEIQEALEPEQFATAVKPAGPVEHIARLSYLYNGLMKDTNVDAAWTWIQFWGENDPTIAFLEETGYFPASEAVATDERITSNPYYGPALDTLKIGRLPVTFVGAAGWGRNVVLPAFQKVLIGSATVEEAVDEMIKGLEDTLA
jgi:multiple sugar transport system substrate-binding protein